MKEMTGKNVPDYVKNAALQLVRKGFEAYLVGGSVRDLYMGKVPKDYDIGTDASPEDIISIFPKSIATGAKFGSIIVLVEDSSGETQALDVTTFRIEQEYTSGRWPSNVKFTNKIEEDLSRRDFTINSMALNLADIDKGDDRILLDPFDGREDIENKVIRAVGNAEERFLEDALRVLRACRFASVLEFELDDDIRKASKTVSTIVDNLSPERVRGEFTKILYDSPKPSKGIRYLKDLGVIAIWIPELLEGVGVDQPEYHVHDVFEHSLRSVDKAEDSVKLAALFHDIAKPRTKKGGHFYRHDVLGEEITRKIMRRLRFSNKEIDRVSTLVRWHMFYFPYDEEDFIKGKRLTEENLKKGKKIGKWKDAAIRRFVRNVGGEESVDELIKLRVADATANPKSEFDEKEIVALQRRISEVRAKDMALKVEDLDINGNDLKKLGIKPGPDMGVILKELLEIVIEDPTMNDRERLLKIVSKKYI